MSEQGEWGPKIAHDGRGCPLPVGVVVWRFFDQVCTEKSRCVEARGKSEYIGPILEGEAKHWDDRQGDRCVQVIAYRVRKSPGFKMIEAALNGDPIEVPQREEVEA